MEFTIFVPAKINLGLEILGKFSDGYHSLATVMQTIDLFDKIKIEKTENNEINIKFNKDINCKKENNSAYIAADEFFNETKIEPCGLEIKIEKNIPIGAGLGGGSADAAGVLVILNNIFDTNLSKEKLLKISKKIGADVPFLIEGGTALAKEVGEKLTKLPSMPDCYIVVTKPYFSVSTEEAYSKVTSKHFSEISIKYLLTAFENRNLSSISKNIFNIFENLLTDDNKIEIQKIKDIFTKNFALGSQMTGSGSAVFGIFENKDFANLCFKKLKNIYPDTFLCKPFDKKIAVI